ncbi:hypothetical protein [Burkholderia vietnamiensis]|uniref:hypothetical protein n=1 Tax=Burkholderia vietnamiensis TaxID=60552 RepID=UPI001B9DADAD|nr:hypothetical protein [Burkholderia vietnamiensis]MBR7998289.1 hypothetical protein [Burkholderia vietnamiensis]
MNCKPGDLAYIVGGLENPSPNLGRIVEVISHYPYEDDFGAAWICKAKSPIETLGADGSTRHDLRFVCADAWLRPIGGVPVTDDIQDMVPA